ncbi:hypothetical protein B0T19DRAFT_269661 [Cercophora scortea]|uniref:Uncharacterized protein n=1 Tax=Cercophora scortea TaxID=314031 RepID=A0AAE0I7J3_9PEZI|nr:hypothetical protein B0T19DRAFT_269661 [Cercophora scortea]
MFIVSDESGVESPKSAASGHDRRQTLAAPASQSNPNSADTPCAPAKHHSTQPGQAPQPIKALDVAISLIKDLNAKRWDKETLDRIVQVLPSLLEAFGLKLELDARSDIIMHRGIRPMDVGVFVWQHEHRDQFQTSFRDLASSAALPPTTTDKTPDSTFNSDTDWSFVKTPAYTWLVESLHTRETWSQPSPDVMGVIGNEILRALLYATDWAFQERPYQMFPVTFMMDWDPVAFLSKQKYSASLGDALAGAITITGSSCDAQALTTAEYLSQIWPATGNYMMQLVTDAVKRGRTSLYCPAVKLPSGNELRARVSEAGFEVEMLGTADFIVEIGQQLGWLGAALRTSPFETGVATCFPSMFRVIREHWQTTPKSASARRSSKRPIDVDFKLYFDVISPDTTSAAKPGQCWHDMFRNPVLVSGYPIMAKPNQILGLEMPLNMVAGMNGSDRVTEFGGKVFIKGYSTMVVATKASQDGSILSWHYLYNPDGQRISYLSCDHGLPDVIENRDIGMAQLNHARHVVGWCDDCLYNAGSKHATYDIDGTGLPPPHAGCLLEKVTLSAGSIITGGVQFAVGVKDIPPHLTRSGYIPKLRWIATKYVLLWDEADKRGWLVNGISALLHLVRATLNHYKDDAFSSAFLLDFSKMQNPSGCTPTSAVEFLINERNRGLEIYGGRLEVSEASKVKQKGLGIHKQPFGEVETSLKKKREYTLLEDLVEQHYNNLEQIIEHQKQAARKGGASLKMRARKHLEGWDFAELATDHDPSPRVATLEAFGYGWVDFVRSIGAVALFGRGFGEILQPVEFRGMCPVWKTLPADKYYMAASVSDMNNITKKFGSALSTPPQPVHDLHWHCSWKSGCHAMSMSTARSLSTKMAPAERKEACAMSLCVYGQSRPRPSAGILPQVVEATCENQGSRRAEGQRRGCLWTQHHLGPPLAKQGG